MKENIIIVGSGPSGLSLAQLLSLQSPDKYSITVIERSKRYGGIHGVDRVNGLFTEHGPRIYSDAYVNFKDLIRGWGKKFEDYFTRYNYPINEISSSIFKGLGVRPSLAFARAFAILAINENYGKKESILQFCIKNNMNLKTIDLIDRLCRLVDGSSVDRFSLNQFLQIANQQTLQPLFQPNTPNDLGFIKDWVEFLQCNGVQFINNEIALQIDVDDKILQTNKNKYNYDTCIFAIPPPNLQTIKGIPRISDKFVNDSMYITYIPVSFHWNRKIDIPKIYGSPFKGDWGVIWITLSDYMQKLNRKDTTLISTCVSYTDRKSLHTGKTANESTSNEIKKEVWRQVIENFNLNDIPRPDNVVIHHSVKRDGNIWINTDYAFADTYLASYMDYKMTDGVYNLGTQNGKSKYVFTSLESAVSNAIGLFNVLTNSKLPIKTSLSIV